MVSSYYYSMNRKQLSSRRKNPKKRRIADLLELTTLKTGFSSRKLILTAISVTMIIFNVSMMIETASLSVTKQPSMLIRNSTYNATRIDSGIEDINENGHGVNTLALPRRQREKQQKRIPRWKEERFRQRKVITIV